MNSMIYRKTILGFSTVAAIVLIAAATLPTGLNITNAQAQGADTSQLIRDYLVQAIQALDNGDNSEAIRQLQFATDLMGTFTGVSDQSNNDNSESDDIEGSEEGPGEDADEPGDTDSYDEED